MGWGSVGGARFGAFDGKVRERVKHDPGRTSRVCVV